MGVYVPIMHMIQGKDGPRANLTTVLRADTISEAARQRGQSFTKVETGDTGVISKPEKKEMYKKERGGGMNKIGPGDALTISKPKG